MRDLGLEIKIKDIKDKIKEAKNIALFTHINVDCDAVGSMCALFEYLEKNNKNVRMFCDSELPIKYSFLNNFDKINKYDLSNNFDLVVSLDTSNPDRLGEYKDFFLKNFNSINIDHHVSNKGYAKIDYIRNYSSCGEVLYEIMKEMSSEISEGIATSLYAAISADTNQFSNPNVTAMTHSYAGELLNFNAQHVKVNYWLHKYKSEKQLRLAGFMATNLKIVNDVAYVLITSKTLNKLRVKINDVSNYINLVSDVEGAKITLIIKEEGKGSYRLNMRSINNYDLNKVAEIFGGGGHKNAAGCTIKGKPSDIIKNVLDECFKEIEDKDRA